MIVKPTEQDFKEGTAVTVLRESRRVAEGASAGVAEGVGAMLGLWFKGMFWFGLICSSLAAMASNGFTYGLAMLLFWAVLYFVISGLWKFAGSRTNSNKKGRPAANSTVDVLPAMPAPGAAPAPRGRQSGTYQLTIARASRQAMKLGIPGALLLPLSFGWGALVSVPGILLFGAATMILLKAFIDKDVVVFDHRSITVNTLLGKGTREWSSVVDVTTRTYGRWNLLRLFITGSRRTIVLSSFDDRKNMTELLIPIDLLDLDSEGLTALVADLLCCRAAGGLVVPAWQSQPASAPAAPPTRTTADAPGDFDPDAIMARYLADRERTIAEVRPDLAEAMAPQPQLQRRTFGRKAASR